MTAIVIDLEWNQPMRGARKVPGLKGEIIQIGAAKVDMSGNVIDTFSATIKPDFYRWINKDISELTRITNEDLNNGESFAEVIPKFKAWCGEDSVFISWGPDDHDMLRNNLDIKEMDSSWLPAAYDAQLMFDDMEKGEDRQYPLNYALWYFNEKCDGQHNALADVLSTVAVLKHLDMEDGLSDEYFRCDYLYDYEDEEQEDI